jgi:ParB family chromosome partitioning protein
MAKGNRRPIGVMAQGAVTQQKDAEIESLREQLEQLKAAQAQSGTGAIQEIPVDQVVPLQIESQNGRLELIRQPRTYFDPEGLEDLTDSIRINGLREPIVVRLLSDGMYGLLDGERRWRAHVSLERKLISASIKGFVSDEAALEWAITTDSLKEKVSPLEQTVSVINLLRLRLNRDENAVRSILYALNNHELGHSVADVDDAISQVIYGVLNSLGLKLGSLVARLPLLDLPSYLRSGVAEGKLSPTNALLINRSPAELHQRLLEEGSDLSKVKLKQLIAKRKAELQPTETADAELTNGFLDSSKPLPEIISDRWAMIKSSEFLLSGGDARSNRKLKKVDALLQEVAAYISQKEISSK